MKYLQYLIIALIVIIPSVLTVLIYNDKITQDSPVYYKQGVEFYNKGDYSNAFYNFSKIKWISPLYPMALYKQGKSAQKLADYSTAVLKYELFLKKNPDSVFANPARYNLAKSYFYLKKYPEAKEQFLIIKQKNPEKPSGSDYYLGLISKQDNKEEAAVFFKNYLKGVLDNKTDDKNFMLSACEELSALGINFSDYDNQLIGRVYYYNKKYSNALEYFSKIPVSSNWDYLVIVNHYSGNKVIAKKLIEDGLNTYSALADENRLRQIYDIYTSYMTSSKIKNWSQMLKIVRENSLRCEDYVMYKLAGMLAGEKSFSLYSDLVNKYPQSNFAAESLWNVFWHKYINKDYLTAESIALKHIKEYPGVNSSTRMLFWLAKTQEKLAKPTEAHALYSKLASRYSDDYYGLRADYILNKRTDFWITDSSDKIKLKEQRDFPISLSNIDMKDLKLINTIFALGDYEVWTDAELGNKIVESWFEQKKGKKSRSIVLARDMLNEMKIKPPFLSAAYRLAYPLYWVNEINIAGHKFQIDPWLIISLIREESYFNEAAISPSNAMGLMQLMPSTANYIVSKFSVNMPTAQDLVNPRINMYLGCYYLKYLKDRFNNDLYVIAAYNGGEGSVNKWIRIFNTSDDDEFIERIPFEETRNYVKKVFRSYHLYKKIYE